MTPSGLFIPHLISPRYELSLPPILLPLTQVPPGRPSSPSPLPPILREPVVTLHASIPITPTHSPHIAPVSNLPLSLLTSHQPIHPSIPHSRHSPAYNAHSPDIQPTPLPLDSRRYANPLLSPASLLPSPDPSRPLPSTIPSTHMLPLYTPPSLPHSPSPPSSTSHVFLKAFPPINPLDLRTTRNTHAYLVSPNSLPLLLSLPRRRTLRLSLPPEESLVAYFSSPRPQRHAVHHHLPNQSAQKNSPMSISDISLAQATQSSTQTLPGSSRQTLACLAASLRVSPTGSLRIPSFLQLLPDPSDDSPGLAVLSYPLHTKSGHSWWGGDGWWGGGWGVLGSGGKRSISRQTSPPLPHRALPPSPPTLSPPPSLPLNQLHAPSRSPKALVACSSKSPAHATSPLPPHQPQIIGTISTIPPTLLRLQLYPSRSTSSLHRSALSLPSSNPLPPPSSLLLPLPPPSPSLLPPPRATTEPRPLIPIPPTLHVYSPPLDATLRSLSVHLTPPRPPSPSTLSHPPLFSSRNTLPHLSRLYLPLPPSHQLLLSSLPPHLSALRSSRSSHSPLSPPRPSSSRTRLGEKLV
uniref:Uncharacterized protein n=1 Tax=Knipowitschia caucasica TaxID=637954 RepID=A0AAV2JV92_KNICA